MGRPSAAYAASPRAATTSANDRRQRLDAAVHSLRKSTQQYGNSSDHDHKHPEEHTDGNNSENDGFLSAGYADEDEDDDYEDYNEEEVRAAAALEQSEMKRQFNFQLEKRRSLKNHFMSAMHKKRRMFMRNENLRFRELYKSPEPMVLLIAVSMVTIVTLILTKSWPFYSAES